MSRTYDHPEPNQWVFPKRNGYRLSCCDCGLTHRVDFRVRNRHIEVRFNHDRRATAAIRREQRKRDARS